MEKGQFVVSKFVVLRWSKNKSKYMLLVLFVLHVFDGLSAYKNGQIVVGFMFYCLPSTASDVDCFDCGSPALNARRWSLLNTLRPRMISLHHQTQQVTCFDYVCYPGLNVFFIIVPCHYCSLSAKSPNYYYVLLLSSCNNDKALVMAIVLGVALGRKPQHVDSLF